MLRCVALYIIVLRSISLCCVTYHCVALCFRSVGRGGSRGLLCAGLRLPQLPGACDRAGQRLGHLPDARAGVQRHLLSTTRGGGHLRGRGGGCR